MLFAAAGAKARVRHVPPPAAERQRGQVFVVHG